jgi:O-antigen/teichoic acid export membrane protein
MHLIFRSSLVRDTSYYSIVKYLSWFIDIFKGVAIAKYLGPEIFGVWAVIQLLVQYGIHLHFGTLYYGDREIPRKLQLGNIPEAEILQTVILWLFIGVITILSILVVALSIVVNNFIQFNHYILIIALPIIISDMLILSMSSWLRSNRKLRLLGSAQLLYSIITFIVILFTINEMNLWAIPLSRVFAVFLYIIVVRKHIPSLYKPPSRTFKQLLQLVISSFSLFLYNISFLLKQSASRWMVIWYLSPEYVGIYSFVLFAYNGIRMAIQGVYSAIYPRLLAKDANGEDISKYNLLLSSIGVVILVPISAICGMLYYLFQPLILPDYGATVAPLLTIILFVILGSPAFGAGIVLLAKYREKKIIYLNLISSIILAVSIGFYLKVKIDLTVIAFIEGLVTFVGGLSTVIINEGRFNKKTIYNTLKYFKIVFIGTLLALIIHTTRNTYFTEKHIMILIEYTSITLIGCYVVYKHMLVIVNFISRAKIHE